MNHYLNIYRSIAGHLYPGGIFTSREDAIEYKSGNALYVQTVEFEVELKEEMECQKQSK